MGKKKDYIILYTLLGIYLIVTLCFYGYQEFLKFREKQKNTYLIFGNSIKFQYENGEWTDIEDEKKYNLINYDIYIDNVKLGNYKLQDFKSKWYLFDDNRNSIQYNGILLAVNTKRNFSTVDYEIKRIDKNDEIILNNILQKHQINKYKLNVNQKVTLDFDSDGVKETLYAISNAFIQDEQKSFALLFIIDDNETIILKQVYKDSGMKDEIPLMKIINIIDIDDDKKYEIIVDESYFNNIRPCSSMYQYDGKINVLKACEEE